MRVKKLKEQEETLTSSHQEWISDKRRWYHTKLLSRKARIRRPINRMQRTRRFACSHAN
jgi:hypothetical protein